ncbi:MAG TPA: OmpH family outer membrane protein [Balneolales bacterium]|nr:OmpH family outer membrane protein [Balneolales bacterium]
MIKRSIALGIIALFLGFVTQTSHAQDLKIGYVDPQAILQKMPAMAAVQKKLQNFADKKKKEYADKQANFREEVQKFQQKSAVISDDAKKKEQQHLQQMSQELQQLQSQYQQDIQKKQSDLVSPLLNQIQDAINQVAKEMNLTYVFNTTTSNGDYIILYASDSAQKKYNITDKVMSKLNLD